MATTTALSLPLTLTRRRIYVFPTGGGVFFGIVATMILLGGINYNNALAYGLAFLLGALLLLTIVHTWRNLAGLRFLGARVEPVFAGDVARFQLSFDNRDGPERPMLSARVRRPRERWWRPPAVARAYFDAEPGGIAQVAVAVPAADRGYLPCPPLVLETRFPLGLIRAWAYLQPEVRCLVYPRPAGRFDLPVDVAERNGGLTEHKAGSEDFAGLRNYQPGDPPRSIAWKALARSDQLEVKRFTGGGARSTWLRWELVEGLATIEARLQQLCRWVLEADRLGIAAGLELPGVRLAPGVGSEHRAACLRALAEFGRA